MQRIRVRTGAVSALLLMGVIGSISMSMPAYAVDTTVNATVRDNASGTITVTTPANNGTITDSSLILTGAIHNIGQIMVYIDGVYSSTVPIDAGATTYTIAVIVPPGTHVIKILAIDPYSSTQVEKTVTTTYVPTVQPSGPISSSPIAGPTLSQARGAIVAAGDAANAEIDRASSSGPMKTLTDSSYAGLVALGLINPRDVRQSNLMPWRFGLVTVGVVLLFAPHLLVSAFQKLRLAPSLTAYSANMMIPVRVLGLVLVILPFVVLS